MKMIEYCFEYVVKKHETLTINSQMKIYIKIESRIIFKNKTEYYLELSTSEAIIFFEAKITKNKNDENVPHL